MRWWRSPRAAAAVAAVSALLSVTVTAPSAVAAPGCQGVGTFCAFGLPDYEGSVHNVVGPKTSPLLGKRNCYDLQMPRQSLYNDTPHIAEIYDDPNCTSLNAIIAPHGYMDQNFGFQSVLFRDL